MGFFLLYLIEKLWMPMDFFFRLVICITVVSVSAGTFLYQWLSRQKPRSHNSSFWTFQSHLESPFVIHLTAHIFAWIWLRETIIPKIIYDAPWSGILLCCLAAIFAQQWILNSKLITKHFSSQNNTVYLYSIFAICLSTLFVALFAFLSWQRYSSYYSQWYDTGFVLQPLQNLIHGRGLMVESAEGGFMHAFGDHFSPILYFLSPFFYLWPSPLLLYLLNASGSALTGLILFKLALRFGIKAQYCLIFLIAFLLNFPLQYALIWDVHSDALVLCFIALMIYSFHCDRPLGVLVCYILASLGKEHISLALVPLMLWFTWKEKHYKKIYAGLSIAGIAYFLAVMIWAIPHFNEGKNSDALRIVFSGGQNDQPFYSIILNLIKEPEPLFSRFLSFRNWESLWILYTTFGLFYFNPLFILGLNSLLFIKEFLNGMYLHNHHWSIIVVLTFYGILINIKDEKYPNLRFAVLYLCFCSLLTNIVHGESPISQRFWRVHSERYTRNEKSDILDSFCSKIPKAASVVTQSHIALHLSDRRKVWLYPRGLQQSEAFEVVIDTSFHETATQIIFNLWGTWENQSKLDSCFLDLQNRCQLLGFQASVFHFHCPPIPKLQVHCLQERRCQCY